MIARDIEVQIATETWPRPADVPTMFQGATGTTAISLTQALLMLGTVTMPNLLSPASPARFWAWLRYFAAISVADDLRITMDFADLDPHQKSILSDDLGVAISTQWLYDRLNGFQKIVDGRRFILQFPHLLRRRTKPAKAKVGPGKAPDFVIRDGAGKWHVLECKGTQSGRYWRNHFLKNARAQKGVVKIVGNMRGERLAAGLAISNEEDDLVTHLRVEDPDKEAEIELGPSEAQAAEAAADRIAVARAMGSIGLTEIALDLWLPPEEAMSDAAEKESVEDFLRPSEVHRFKPSREERLHRARQQFKDRPLVSFVSQGTRYRGRRIEVELPELAGFEGTRGVEVRLGVNADLLGSIEGASDQLDERDKSVEPFARGKGVAVETRGRRTILKYGDVMAADLTLLKA